MVFRLLVFDPIKSQFQPVTQLAHFRASNPFSIRGYAPAPQRFPHHRFWLSALDANALDRLIVSAVHVKHPLSVARTLRFALIGSKRELLQVRSVAVHPPKILRHFPGAP